MEEIDIKKRFQKHYPMTYVECYVKKTMTPKDCDRFIRMFIECRDKISPFR
jgi:hypothetical protein